MNHFYISNMITTISDSNLAEKVEGVLHQISSSPIFFHVNELFRINAETILKVRSQGYQVYNLLETFYLSTEKNTFEL